MHRWVNRRNTIFTYTGSCFGKPTSHRKCYWAENYFRFHILNATDPPPRDENDDRVLCCTSGYRHQTKSGNCNLLSALTSRSHALQTKIYTIMCLKTGMQEKNRILLESGAILQWRLHDRNLSHFDTIPECGRRTVRETDRRTDLSYSALHNKLCRVLTCCKNCALYAAFSGHGCSAVRYGQGEERVSML